MSNEVKGTGMDENTCGRCGRKLTRSTGYGPKCAARIRKAAAQAQVTAKPEQHAKAVELITDGGIVPTNRPGVFAAVSSDGFVIYLPDTSAGTCTCKAGQNGRHCYHLAAANILTIASARRAA